MRIVNFSIDANEIEIVPFADWHIGNPTADIERIKEITDYVSTHENAYCILNGDIVDNNIRNSIGNGIFEQTMSPLDQVTTASYYLQNVARQKKIINFCVGNHELRSQKDTGLSPADLLLANLMKYDDSLNDRYCEDGAFTFISLNSRTKGSMKSVVTMFNLHGNGSGSKIGNKIQRLDDMSMVVSQCDIFVRSHTHVPETHRGVYFEVNKNERTVKEQSCIYVNTGSMLKYNGGYGARAGMKPLSRGIPVIRIRIVRKRNNYKELYVRNIECVIKDRLGD